jgi:transcriptional regulator with XRE-family HTH domain
MTTFQVVLCRLRKRYIGKQLALAASIGCTEAAISFWEHGRRLPLRTLLPRIVECLHAGGAGVMEIEELQQEYNRCRSGRAWEARSERLLKLAPTPTPRKENSSNGKFHGSR